MSEETSVIEQAWLCVHVWYLLCPDNKEQNVLLSCDDITDHWSSHVIASSSSAVYRQSCQWTRFDHRVYSRHLCLWLLSAFDLSCSVKLEWISSVITRNQLKPAFTFSTKNETSAENDIWILAKTKTKTKIGIHFRPKTKPKLIFSAHNR